MSKGRPAWARLDPADLSPGKPRAFLEWRTLRTWGKLPEREYYVPGYLLRDLREQCGLTQAELAQRLGTSQQAVSSAERWNSNPTLKLVFAWQRACNSPIGLAEKGPRRPAQGDPAKGSRNRPGPVPSP